VHIVNDKLNQRRGSLNVYSVAALQCNLIIFTSVYDKNSRFHFALL
jgi:hypothetical protein